MFMNYCAEQISSRVSQFMNVRKKKEKIKTLLTAFLFIVYISFFLVKELLVRRNVMYYWNLPFVNFWSQLEKDQELKIRLYKNFEEQREIYCRHQRKNKVRFFIYFYKVSLHVLLTLPQREYIVKNEILTHEFTVQTIV